VKNKLTLARRSLIAAPLAAAQAQLGPVAQKRNASNAQASLYASIAAFWEPHDREMLHWLGVARGARVLDLGCGRGDHLMLFAEMLESGPPVTGFDAVGPRGQFCARGISIVYRSPAGPSIWSGPATCSTAYRIFRRLPPLCIMCSARAAVSLCARIG